MKSGHGSSPSFQAVSHCPRFSKLIATESGTTPKFEHKRCHARAEHQVTAALPCESTIAAEGRLAVRQVGNKAEPITSTVLGY